MNKQEKGNYEEETIAEIMEMKIFKTSEHLIRMKMYGQMNISWFSAGNRKMRQTQEQWKEEIL
jgi:hypothetical protein